MCADLIEWVWDVAWVIDYDIMTPLGVGNRGSVKVSSVDLVWENGHMRAYISRLNNCYAH